MERTKSLSRRNFLKSCAATGVGLFSLNKPEGGNPPLFSSNADDGRLAVSIVASLDRPFGYSQDLLKAIQADPNINLLVETGVYTLARVITFWLTDQRLTEDSEKRIYDAIVGLIASVRDAETVSGSQPEIKPTPAPYSPPKPIYPQAKSEILLPSQG